MHAALLTLILTAGAEAGISDTGSYLSDGGGGSHAHHGHCRFIADHGGPMPQTCYSPRYGCYFGNNRHMHRYPAFHGTFYRRPYNYRNTFDYPWHAALHEPTSHFSYHVPPENEWSGPAPVPGAQATGSARSVLDWSAP